MFNFRRNAEEVITQELEQFDSDDAPISDPPFSRKSVFKVHPQARKGVRYYYSEDMQDSLANCDPIEYIRELDSKNVTSCGYYAGKKDESSVLFDKNTLPLHNLLKSYRKLGYSYHPWDGITARPILDWDGRVFAVLAGRPTDPEYADSCRLAFEAINKEGRSARFVEDHLVHKRGDFPAVNVGVSHGIGTTRPINLQNNKLNNVMDRLLCDPSLERISSFQDATFRLWAPKLYEYYSENLDKIWNAYPELRPGFANSIWPCTAINFGPKVYTWPHRDCMNLSFGWCSIIALGTFDSKKGGHLVMPDLRMIVEFPSGSNVLIPSALLTHCNIPVAEKEARVSFTQFCAGELFRFADCKLRTEAEVRKQDPRLYAELQGRKPTRWRDGLAKYRIWDTRFSC